MSPPLPQIDGECESTVCLDANANSVQNCSGREIGVSNAQADIASCPMDVSNRYGLIFRLVRKGAHNVAGIPHCAAEDR
jgi:hypothetical protein